MGHFRFAPQPFAFSDRSIIPPRKNFVPGGRLGKIFAKL